MPKAFSIKTTGIAKTSAMLLAKNKLIKLNIAKGMEKIGKEVKEEVKDSIRGHKAELRSIDTGEFLESVDSKSSKNTATIFSDVNHSVFMEFGTIRIPERRHFRNSIDRKKRDIQSILNKAVGKVT